MVKVLSFPNPEAMQAYLASAKDAAAKGLHVLQHSITYGEHWVRFAGPIVEFGRVATLTEVGVAEVRAGASSAEASQVVAETEAKHLEHLMYGDAYSVLGPEGEVGYTHKAHVWPIDEVVFEAAREAGWDVTKMDTEHQLTLSLAYRAWFAHTQPTGTGDE